MKVRCPHCRIRGDVAATLGGRVVRCPRCLASFRVPLPHQPEENGEPAQSIPTDREKQQQRRSIAGAPGAADPEPTAALSHKPVENLELNNPGVSCEVETHGHLANAARLEPDEGGDSWRMASASAAVDAPAAPERAAVLADEDDAVAGGQQETSMAAAEFPDLSAQRVAWEAGSADHPHGDAPVSGQSGVPDDRDAAGDTEEKVQKELAALLSETCSVCGKTMPDGVSNDSGEPKRCEQCRQDQSAGETQVPPLLFDDYEDPSAQSSSSEQLPPGGYTPDGGFRWTAILKAAWTMVGGVKGPIWGGVLALLLVLAGVETAATVLVPFAVTLGGEAAAIWLQILLRVAGSVLFLTFLAGLYTIGVRRSCGRPFSWKTVFSGFSFVGRIGVAGFLMSLLILSGFVLLVLPGIYLVVGYSLTLPLMVEKQYGPWEAMEASRRLIHRRWWQVFGIYIAMYLIYLLSCIPFGIGLFWTIPMLFTLTGVLYRTLVPESTSE